MTLNREVFLKDPVATIIPNEGVTKVLVPETPEQWDTLRYELSSFVCEGEYAQGLERILSSYLDHLNHPEQPAFWVSGFYGSGKSHLVRVLEYLWRDVEFPDGATARGLVHLPDEIYAQLRELTMVGKREGGIWSAAGMLSSGAGDNVRLALLGILFRNAGLPAAYQPARLAIWLKNNSYYEAVAAGIERWGKEPRRELHAMYVSPPLAQSLAEAVPDFPSTPSEVREILLAQYPPQGDVTEEEMLQTMHDVLCLQSPNGRLPCALLIFDELQQFIGEDPGRALDVQTAVEACAVRFGSRLLFVGTGQSALQATPQLSKLKGRFSRPIELSDKDVETVVREVVLRKAPERVPELETVLQRVSGEIDRQLAGTKLGARQAELPDLVPEYPLLPVRRRFWESVLRAVDTGGGSGLRTQLRIVHDTTAEVGNETLGHAIPADAIYWQLEPDMRQTGVLTQEQQEVITRQDDGTADGHIRSRLLATIFLINKLPTTGIAATGVRATAESLADLLVEDLAAGSTELRQRIPLLLDALVEHGYLIHPGDEYRLQTRASQEWETDFRARLGKIRGDDARIASDRAAALQRAVNAELRGITLVQGESKTPRKFQVRFGAAEPSIDGNAIPVWVRDEWSVSERTVREEAQRAGEDSPLVFVFLPRVDADSVRDAVARIAAAQETIDTRPPGSTQEEIEARMGMIARRDTEQARLDGLAGRILRGARVYQGGGNEVTEQSLQESVRVAVTRALHRLFPDFDLVDNSGWGLVVKRAADGAADALRAVDYSGPVESYTPCTRVREFIGGAGKQGSAVRKHFMAPPFGWPQDAIDGILLVLLANGLVRASRNGQLVQPKGLNQSQISVSEFFREGIVVDFSTRLGIRQFLTALQLPFKPNEEAYALGPALTKLAELAAQAGGEPPLPAAPAAGQVKYLQGLAGNEQMVAVCEHREELLGDYQRWQATRDAIAHRLPQWHLLTSLLRHADGLAIATPIRTQAEAIVAQRGLLQEPNPVPPLLTELASALRGALREARAELVEVRKQQLALLEESTDWQKVAAEEREQILSANDLALVPELRVATDEALLQSLAGVSLRDWSDRAAAVPTRVAQARLQVAELGAEKPVQRVTLPPATLETEDEVRAYVQRVEAELLDVVRANKRAVI